LSDSSSLALWFIGRSASRAGESTTEGRQRCCTDGDPGPREPIHIGNIRSPISLNGLRLSTRLVSGASVKSTCEIQTLFDDRQNHFEFLFISRSVDHDLSSEVAKRVSFTPAQFANFVRTFQWQAKVGARVRHTMNMDRFERLSGR